MKRVYKIKRRDEFSDGEVEWYTVYSTESPEAARKGTLERRGIAPNTTFKIFMITEEKLDF
jgi:hypothetical protein